MQAPVLTKHWVRNTASRLSFSSRTRQQRGLAAAQRESQSRSLRLVGPNGVTSIAPDQEVLIGSDPQCDIHIESAPGEQPSRALVAFRKGRAYVKSVSQQPLSDDDFDLIPLATGIFVDNRELRPGVDYLVSPGAQLRFGDASDDQQTLRVEFKEPETGNAAGLDMMMKAMARTPEVRQQLE